MAQRIIPCSELYSLSHGPDAKGGAYNTLQRALAAAGWVYNIAIDAWVEPKLADADATELH